MSAEDLQALFLRAHVALHPEGEAIAALLASGVSVRRTLELYPYDLAEWLPTLIADWDWLNALRPVKASPEQGHAMLWRGIEIRDYTMHARLRGIEEDSRRLPGHGWAQYLQEQDNRCLATLLTPAGHDLLTSMGFVITQRADVTTVAGSFMAANQLIATASGWPDRPALLHENEAVWRHMVESSLAVLAPKHFSVERPPERHDTMMFR